MYSWNLHQILKPEDLIAGMIVVMFVMFLFALSAPRKK